MSEAQKQLLQDSAFLKVAKVPTENSLIIQDLWTRNEYLAARKIEQLSKSLDEVMTWIDNWDPNFADCTDWPEAKKRALLALGKN